MQEKHYNREYDFSDLIDPADEPGENGDYYVVCPLCREEKGPKYQKKKLCIKGDLSRGYCNRCGTLFFPKPDGTTSRKRIKPIFCPEKDPEDFSLEVVDCKKYEIAKEELQEGIDYLASRDPWYRKNYKKLGIRFLDNEVVIPFFFDGKVVYYQSRLIKPHTADHKYDNPRGSKPIYICPISNLSSTKIILCEGVFGAISIARRYPEYKVVAVLGSHLSSYQKFLLSEISFSEFVLYFDDVGIDFRVREQLLDYFGSIPIKIIESPLGDPEDDLKKVRKDVPRIQEASEVSFANLMSSQLGITLPSGTKKQPPAPTPATSPTYQANTVSSTFTFPESSSDFLEKFKEALESAPDIGTENFHEATIDLYRDKYLGEIVGRPILDTKGRPFRMITNVREVFIFGFLETYGERSFLPCKHFYWMASDNYKNLTPDQRNLNDELGELIIKVDKLCEENLIEEILRKWRLFSPAEREGIIPEHDVSEIRIKKRKQLFLMYMKPMALYRDGRLKFENGGVSLLLHYGSDFAEALGKAVNNLLSKASEEEEKKKMYEECFSRTNGGKYLFSITTSKPINGLGRYTVNMRFYESEEKYHGRRKDFKKAATPLYKYELDRTRNLMTRLISVTFKEAQTRKNKKFMEELIAKLETWREFLQRNS